MKYILPIIIGFLLNLLCHTLFGQIGYSVVAFVYCSLLFGLFFSDKTFWFTFLVVGVTAGEELLVHNHFGLSTLVGLAALISHDIFGTIWRFTPLYIRYLMANALVLLLYLFVHFSTGGTLSYLVNIVVIWLLAALGALLFTQLRPSSSYELL